MQDDAISREAFITRYREWMKSEYGKTPDDDTLAIRVIKSLPSVTHKSGKCKDCKWWKDSDGVYRRGIGAESKCPINNMSVNHGFGYCYMFEPQESEK